MIRHGHSTYMFDEFDLSFAVITETWFKSGKQLTEELAELKDSEDIGIIARNRMTRGGGVAVAYRTTKANVKEFKLPSNTFEMVCVVDNTTATNRKVAIIALYVPPRQRVATTLKMRDCLVDRINKLKIAYDDPMIFVAGDTNNRTMMDLMSDFSDISTVTTLPTRGTALLDEVACNFTQYVTNTLVKHPLQAEDGTNSDHSAVLVKTKIPTMHHFTKRKFRHQPITTEGRERFVREVTLMDWSPVYKECPSAASDALWNILKKLTDDCFPWVERTIKSTDAPWITPEGKRKVRRRKRICAREGRSERWYRAKKVLKYISIRTRRNSLRR